MLELKQARTHRTLERFRSTGLVERVPHQAKISSALWSAMTTQYQRRGEDWLLNKGGFQRVLNENTAKTLLKSLAENKLKSEDIDNTLSDYSLEQKALLLNLLGGRLAYGYRLIGGNIDELSRRHLDRLNSVLMRLARVGKWVDQAAEQANAEQ